MGNRDRDPFRDAGRMFVDIVITIAFILAVILGGIAFLGW